MTLTLGFDVFGTLIDTHGVVVQLQTMIGDDAPRFSQVWREKQLEYTFRRGLMNKYQNFGVCTRDALNYTAQFLGHSLSEDQKQILIAAYSTLPAFSDAIQGLKDVKAAGHRLFAFSNGQAHAVDTVLTNAGIRDYFEGTVSVDSIGTFKPNPATYHHFLESTGTTARDGWLISSNGFDVIGAVAIGMNAAWIQRSTAVVFDPWEFEPTVTLSSLEQLTNNLP
jgi:2-haloacid dehalogenase